MCSKFLQGCNNCSKRIVNVCTWVGIKALCTRQTSAGMAFPANEAE